MTTEATDEVMIQASNLTHYYGPQPAIEDVNFDVKKGEVLGFLGPNGAGKTTTLGMARLFESSLTWKGIRSESLGPTPGPTSFPRPRRIHR